jgi:UDP-glucose 4-epimerase
LKGRQFNAVIHFAAYIEVGESVKDPAAFWTNNVFGTAALLKWMAANGQPPIVFSSTAAVYGEPQQVPIPESHPKAPASPYGETKLAVERILAAYDSAYGQKSVVLRYFNACGADPDGVLGEDHRPETHLIPRCLLAAAGRAPELTLFGVDYPTPDGTCIRDYVHVEDLAEAHVLALNHLAKGGDSRYYNLGSGEGFSVKEVIDACEEASGRKIPVRLAERRPGDPARLIADSSAIRRDWGWSPQYTSLPETASHAWQWMSGHPEGYGSATP